TDLRYEQRFQDAGEGRQLPYEMRLTGTLHRAIAAHWLPQSVAGVRVPEFPRQVAFEEIARLSGYTFDGSAPPPDLAESRPVVRDRVDDADSGAWSGPGAVPLTDAERAAWQAGDSSQRHPG